MEAIDRLIEFYGNTSKASKALGEDRQLVEMWVRKGFIPFHRGDQVEKATNGHITAYEVYVSAAKTNSNGGHHENSK